MSHDQNFARKDISRGQVRMANGRCLPVRKVRINQPWNKMIEQPSSACMDANRARAWGTFDRTGLKLTGALVMLPIQLCRLRLQKEIVLGVQRIGWWSIGQAERGKRLLHVGAASAIHLARVSSRPLPKTYRATLSIFIQGARWRFWSGLRD